MRLKLPLLMASSLLWQAAAWGDEWVDYATAVTVTDGYLCAGEIYGDGTGTDIKCDMGNPFVDGDGNVGIGTATPANSLTVVGDLSATTLNAAQLCDEDGANCTDLSGGLSGVSSLASLTDVSVSTPSDNNLLRYNTSTSKWEAVGINDGLSTTTMVPGWPDAIDCGNTNNSSRPFIYYINLQFSTGVETYYQAGSTSGGSDVVRFNTASKEVSVAGGSVCTSGKSIADLYSEGRAFNFLGNNGAQISLTQIADVSAAAPTQGEVLSWNDSSGRWEPSATASAIDALGDIGDVSDTAAGDGQVLAWDNANSEWAPKNAQEASVFSCPAGFTLIQNAGQTLGCMQTDEEGSGDWPTAVDACFDNYGGRLPTTTEWYVAMANYTLTNETGNWETASDAEYNSVENHAIVGNASISDFFRGSDTFERPYRCFIPASGQISMTTIVALSDVSASAPNDGDGLVYNSGTGNWDATPVMGQLFHVQDQKSNGTDGGTFTSGAWRTRDLNATLTNEISGASLTSNQITLPAGSYYIEASAPARDVNGHTLKLRNITDTSDALIGRANYTASSSVQTLARVSGVVTITSSKVFELQHYSGSSNASSGFGAGYTGDGVTEVFADIQVWKR